MRGATSRNTPAAKVTSGRRGLAASGCIHRLYQIRWIPPMRRVNVMRKSAGQSPDHRGRGCRRDQMFQGVSADETEGVRDLVVEQLGRLGQDVQKHRGGEGDAIGARGAMD